ncbi:hypothetical protein AOC36_04380 [Erysipelothrix larvae]|uniref:peptidoglycan glycosyltransferase n=1 Tax=Erysipelothrix larvae TaxID=1514105 RepID=A0A0X8GZD1_9FIRM|nr:biosynthetic peptidoglycan transglycosylase [Erysipelothrix larvae]AMC93234.1 hypothetical protein AOC36_04380 [Erysipelothrix larvae]
MKKFLKRVLVWTLIVTLVVSTVLIFLGLQDYKRVVAQRPIETYVAQIQAEPGFVSLDEVSEMFVDAVVAVEDSRFWTRNSVLDIRAIGRATYVNLTNLNFLEGASTIPQQVAKNMYFDEEVSVIRKISEFFVARHLDNLYTRAEILELYINKIYYGANAYGISEASLIYFDTTPLNLTDAQATMLAGLPQAPSSFNPFLFYESAKARQRIVINRLISNGFITEEFGEEIYQMEVFND